MKKALMICLAAALFTICAQKQARAQLELEHVVVDGVVLKGNSYSIYNDIEGSPFLNEDWVDGTATSDKGEKYTVRLKFDIYKNLLVFADKDGGPMSFTVPVTKFTMGELKFANGFPAFDKLTDKTYYQVLNEGSTQLLKREVRKVLEERDVSGVVVGRKFENGVEYYLYKNNKVSLINPNKSNITNAFSDKQTQFADYLKNNKVNFKSDADLAKLFNWYNGL